MPVSPSISLAQIQAPIAAEMEEFEHKFRQSMRTKVLLLDKIMGYIVKRKGKQIRPMFVFLTAHITAADPTAPLPEASFRGAALIELLHTATLVHDDVVDESNYRRGFFSINALWKNKIAVLVGDYLLSRGLLLSLENDDYDLLKIVSNAVRELSEGELLQIEKARRLDITEDVYFEIIRQKTASLIASCTAVGASSTGADKETIERARLFGEKVGIAFQIKDDLFDYGTEEIGKPVGIDIKEKKMTLPLIHALSKASWLEKRKVIFNVKNNEGRRDRVQAVIEFVKQSGGLDYAIGVMKQYRDEALAILYTFPDSPSRTSLEQLINYTIEREK
ncbi:polyprenyl synthetase family protein [Hymenobacter sp. ASUV-10]|uniref:Polyprenyl synthetase family protein n=1 Tax=Hymenobacter aranciens TaxID=3063996 RepID=A0ABT9BG59_9BACT|nr:polyprenyl synthetase family protein [Hymenobacter sp. ASUV-10]MDO7876775.1 polyprenyl synthetase family protein [Hymenobacter sp. ASUV-10]